MGLNIQKGNMYGFVTHTWNTIKGQCYHDCVYCYMKRFDSLKPVRFDKKELKTDLGSGNFIFVGSSCDMFAPDIKREWIIKTLEHCRKFDNQYLFQSKNPERFEKFNWVNQLSIENDILCTTIETNRNYSNVTKAIPPKERALQLSTYLDWKKMVTIEPIMDFDLNEFIDLIKNVEPIQVNIGADSKGHNLPEPTIDKTKELISELEQFTKVSQKPNLKRLLR